MADEPDTILSNPLTGEVTTKLPEIDPEPVPGAEDLPDDVKNDVIPPELQANVGAEPVVEDI